MEPKEKAWDLNQKFMELQHYLENNAWNNSKQCASLAVDEILNTLKIFPEKDTTSKSVVNFSVSRIMYWVQVKNEIEKL